jgi:hypothetical protein
MTRSKAATWVLILFLLGGGWYTVEGLLSARLRGAERDRFVARLSEAQALLARHPDIFRGGAGAPAGDLPLKTVLQDASTKHGLQLGFLSEADKEAGKGRREKQVSARLVRAPHEKIVPFLADLEALGAGSVVKELHLRPSKEQSDLYEEAEVVFSRAYTAPGGKP